MHIIIQYVIQRFFPGNSRDLALVVIIYMLALLSVHGDMLIAYLLSLLSG